MLEADTVVVVNDDDGKNIVGRGVGDIVVNGMCNNSEAVQDRRSGRIAVEANGRALKVHAGETPHLVSLGSDRFSTAVTLHPIPKGRVTIGSRKSADIVICGTGVEEVHCWIENNEGIVVVHPSNENVPIQVDGLKVSQPTRLTQGCMLCLGRSNYFRFNHPQEARYMKSILPNTRVSIMPNAFHPITNSDDASVSESKISTDSRRSYDSPDSWYEISSGTSSEDLLNTTSHRNDTTLPIAKHISPKVFLPGSSTLNSPASVVLGRHKYPGHTPNTKSPFYNSVTVYEDRIENFRGLGSPAESIQSLANGGPGCVNDRNNNISKEHNGNEDKNSVKFSSSESLSPKQKIVPPSPAFNRNPSYFNSKCSSPTNDYNSFSASPLLFTSSPRFSNGSATTKIDRNGSLSSPTNSYDSIGSFCENGFRKGDSEMKRKQAHQNRILEQERERVERLRLEEILTACADYEKQAQNDRFNKPQIRIKTNGSLPRDKQCLSPIAKTPESPRNGIVFNFDKNDSSTVSNSDHQSEKSSYPNSPRTRIKTVASPKIARKDYSLEILENKLALLNEYEVSNSSPATIRRANTNTHGMRNHVTEFNAKNSPKFYHQDRSMNGYSNPDRLANAIASIDSANSNSTYSSIAKSNTLKKYKFLGIDPDAINTSNQDSLPKTDVMSKSYHESFVSKKTSDNDEEAIMSTSLINFDSAANHNQNDLANFSSNDYAKSKSTTLLPHRKKDFDDKVDKDDGIEKLNGLVLELNEIVRENEKTKERASNVSKAKFILPLEENPSNKESKFILPLEEIDIALKRQRFSMKKCELKRLQSEQSRLMDAINNVKTKLLDIQQQKDEIIRELEMEKALLEGELKAENEKLVSEEEFYSNVQEKVNQCEKQIEACSKQQTERQDQNKSVVDEQQNILNVLQSNLSCISNENDKSSIIESIGKSKEILEEETKSFEDFEFRLLEEEAALLSKRDELQSELNKINNAMEHTRSKITGLYSQKEQLLQNASDEIRSLELQVRCHTRTLQQNHGRLQDISVQLKETSKSLNEISEEAMDSCDETVYSYKTQSQEDLDRISRVTSDAPLMESGSTNSLGRRTIASLQQIERNRQLHLAQQGGHVIEEERKRMLALKRRVQDEVTAQWEEDKKQRENNCSSITSIGSDNSSVLSSDRVTESPNNEEKLPVKGTAENERVEENGNAVQPSMQTATTGQKDDEEGERSSKHKRPSNASVTTENGSVVKLRLSRGDINQRPESRYSAYKRASLDLRQHIESAGHQLDHCPQIFVDKTSCRGYLQKMTTKFRSWNKRWFVFDRKKCSFTYYSDKSEKKLKGGAYFQGLLDLCIDNTNSIRSPNPQATFIVKSTERVYYLLAPSIEAMRIWFDVLATEVETFQDT